MPGGPTGKQGGGRPPRKLVITAGAVAAVTVAIVAFAIVATGGDGAERSGGTASAEPPAWSREAGRQLKALPGLRYDGTVTMNGAAVRLRLKVTRSGLATGTLGDGTVEADLVAAGGSAYVKGGPVFWRTRTEEAARAGTFAGRWTRVPASFPALSALRDALTPQAVSRALATAPRNAPTENVGGTPAYRVKTAKADYLFADAAPHRLLEVRTAGRGAPRLTAVPLADPALALKQIRPRVAALGGSIDPALRFRPAAPRFVNCDQNASGCTLVVEATLTRPAGTVPGGARAALRARITTEGRRLGSCTSSAAVAADRKVTLRCTVSDRGWRHWMRAALDDPGRYPYQAHAVVIGEALTKEDVGRLLDQVDRERAAIVVPSAAPSAGGSGAPSGAPSGTASPPADGTPPTP